MPTNTELSPFSGDNTRVDAATAALVERGVEFHKTLGKTVATAYFMENHVPNAVIGRILGNLQARRAAGPRRAHPDQARAG